MPGICIPSSNGLLWLRCYRFFHAFVDQSETAFLFFQMRLGQMMLKATVLSLAIFTLSEVQFSGMVLANEA